MMTRLDPIGLMALAGPWALVLGRALGLAWTAPALGLAGLGVRFRLILAATLAILVGPIVARGMATPADPGPLLLAMLGEVAVGAMLGWSGSLVVAGARQAGEVVGLQAGLAPAALLDPEAGEGMTPLGHLYGLIATACFLGLDGPTELVRALAASYRLVPAGGADLAGGVGLMFGRVAGALELTLRASAPPAIALVMAGLAMGLLGRAAPGLGLLALSMPARAALGLILAMLGLAALAATIGSAWARSFPFGF